MIRVVIADDHPVVRKGLILILSGDAGLTVVAEAANSGEIFNVLDKNQVDVLLMDIHMPGRTGLELLPELKQRYPRLPVLILSQYPEDQMAVRAIKAGAAGYITKGTPPEELISAIHKVHDGRRYLTPTLAELLADTIESKSELPHQDLSDREYQVFSLIASGKTVSEIARDINLSVKTVSTYRTRILEKMGLQTNAELTRYAFQHKLIA